MILKLEGLIPAATSHKIAFTLAEVLITLGIIGVVSAITIPALINEHKKIVTVNKLKKNYVLFAQVFQMAERENGFAENWDYSLSHTEFAEKYFYLIFQMQKNLMLNTKLKL